MLLVTVILFSFHLGLDLTHKWGSTCKHPACRVTNVSGFLKYNF
uniref:Uncharacterized protein n=1 Tax=Anguilla anguilla TaxID=7936 RepID=A0A0E9V2Q1_ANGAN